MFLALAQKETEKNQESPVHVKKKENKKKIIQKRFLAFSTRVAVAIIYPPTFPPVRCPLQRRNHRERYMQLDIRRVNERNQKVLSRATSWANQNNV